MLGVLLLPLALVQPLQIAGAHQILVFDYYFVSGKYLLSDAAYLLEAAFTTLVKLLGSSTAS